MNKINILFFCFLSVFLFAQNRFVYEYSYKPEKGKDSLVTDIWYLDEYSSRSYFYDSSKTKVDSITEILKVNKSFQPIFPKYNSNLNHSISKNTTNKDIIYHVKFSGYKFKISEKSKFKWDIKDETEILGKYACQKATTNFGGRKWIAWFTTQIPIPDGPYKFGGLPGLILKIEDSDKNHSFELVEIQKNNGGILPSFAGEKEIKKEQLNKLLDERSQNINQNIYGMYVNGNVVSLILKDGNLLQVEKSKKGLMKQLETKLKRSDNPIELE